MTGQPSASIEIGLGELGTSLCGLRLCAPAAQEQMQLSLSKLGQLTPVQAFRAASGLELYDGIKRWNAAQALLSPVEKIRGNLAEEGVRRG